MISFQVSREDADLIRQILNRVGKLAAEHKRPIDVVSMSMDITACHANGCPLDLAKLLAAPDFDFVHDVYGITRRLNRETGKLNDCFLPRTARPDGEPRLSSDDAQEPPADDGQSFPSDDGTQAPIKHGEPRYAERRRRRGK